MQAEGLLISITQPRQFRAVGLLGLFKAGTDDLRESLLVELSGRDAYRQGYELASSDPNVEYVSKLRGQIRIHRVEDFARLPTAGSPDPDEGGES